MVARVGMTTLTLRAGQAICSQTGPHCLLVHASNNVSLAGNSLGLSIHVLFQLMVLGRLEPSHFFFLVLNSPPRQQQTSLGRQIDCVWFQGNDVDF